MTIYERGAKGPEVEAIQEALKKRGLYSGPVDGVFGGGTESAVKVFQRKAGLTADGEVGPQTWSRLFAPAGGGKTGPSTATQPAAAAAPPEPAITKEPLLYRCLALTGSFETSEGVPGCFAGLSGDFDGQGISFGALQWCLGQGSLQPLLAEMLQTHEELVKDIFDDNTAVLRAMLGEDRDEQMTWARSIQDRQKSRLHEPWRGQFKTLGRHKAFQDVQVRTAQGLFEQALDMCHTYGVTSERAAALLFDIKTQNGSIKPVVKAQIENDFKRLERSAGGADDEVARLRIIANRRAEAANPRWIEDVRRRKLTIAEGGGVVHGNRYNLATQYGIRLTSFTG